MTNIDTYYAEAAKPNGSLMGKMGSALKSVKDRTLPNEQTRSEMGRKVRHTGKKAVITVRRHPVKSSLGAVGVLAAAAGAFLLIYPKTRKGGMELARKGLESLKR